MNRPNRDFQRPPLHVLWDWNGTLLDDTRACLEVINRLLAERALPAIDLRTYRRHFGFPVRRFYFFLGLHPAPGEWQELARRFHELYLQQPMRASPAGREAVARLASRGLPQSVLSACEQNLLETMIARYGFKDRFVAVQGTDNLDGRSKIDGARRLVDRLGLAPRDLLLIGDTQHDAEVAAALGCECLLVAEGHQSHERLAATGCRVIESLAQVATSLGA